MTGNYTYPGVYIEEIPSGVRTIVGVSTSVAAFIDFFKRGPMNKAVQIFNFGDFEREFGGLNARSEASYGIQQFFLNGGSESWVVRVASGTPVAAEVQIGNAIGAAAAALTVSAISPGTWGNTLRIGVEPATLVDNEFNLIISQAAPAGGGPAPAQPEIFRNLSAKSGQANFVENVINDLTRGSKLVRVKANGDAPLACGTLSGAHAKPEAVVVPAAPAVSVTIDNGIAADKTVATATLSFPSSVDLAKPQPLAVVAPVLEAAIRAAAPANPAFANATVQVIGARLHVLAGPGNSANRITFANDGTNNTASNLLLTTTANLQEYSLGAGPIASTAQIQATAGDDGSPPDGTALIGSLANKQGMYALEEVDLFNLLCIPRTAVTSGTGGLDPTQARAVISVAQTYCEKRRAFFLMDTPVGVNEPTEIKNTLTGLPRHRNAALYYPRIQIPDPLNDSRPRSVGASGTIAGLYARTDSTRGVWKAPAGTDATLRNVDQLEDLLTDAENGDLNRLAINCLRTFPIFGPICWGARTLEGSDQQASEWKYIPVRRLALFLEESLYRSLKWVVFEPNDEPLWAQIRLNVGSFMHDLFRQGAFQGRTPREAYLVKCDRETTTQSDINNGIVNILVGFAPLKPAEFVIVKIQQMAGQIEV